MALASNALTTVAEIQSLGTFADTAKIERAINLASEIIEMHLQRELGYVANGVDLLNGTGTRRLYLDRYPIISVSQVKIQDNTQDSSTYSLSTKGKKQGWVYRSSGWPIYADTEYPTGDAIDMDYEPYEITYSGGYRLPNMSTIANSTDLPISIQTACNLAALDYLKNPTSTGGKIVQERAATGWMIKLQEREIDKTSMIADLIPSRALALLAPYVRIPC